MKKLVLFASGVRASIGATMTAGNVSAGVRQWASGNALRVLKVGDKVV